MSRPRPSSPPPVRAGGAPHPDAAAPLRGAAARIHQRPKTVKRPNMSQTPKTAKRQKAIIYMRVSTAGQAETGLGLDAQEAACRDYVRKRDLELVRCYEDPGVTSRIAFNERPAGQHCAAALEHGITEPWTFHLVVHSMSRLWRSFHEGQLDLEWFKQHKITLHMVKEGLVIGESENLTSAERFAHTVITSVFLAASQMERDVISERTREALAAKQARGEYVGRPPLGFRHGAKGQLVPVKRELEALGALLALRNLGNSVRGTAKELNRLGFKTKLGRRWGPSSVGSCEKNARSEPDTVRLAVEAYRVWYEHQTDEVAAEQ